jgi:hypothetical protein
MPSIIQKSESQLTGIFIGHRAEIHWCLVQAAAMPGAGRENKDRHTWVRAINQSGGFGEWQSALVTDGVRMAKQTLFQDVAIIGNTPTGITTQSFIGAHRTRESNAWLMNS